MSSEAEIHSEVVNQLIIATPEWWREARLELIRSDGTEGQSCSHTISSNQHPKDIVVATDELMEATRKLVLLHKSQGHNWLAAVYQIKQGDNDAWVFEVNYRY